MHSLLGPILFIIKFILFFIWSSIVACFAIIFCWLLPKWKSVKLLTKVANIWAYGSAKIFGLRIKVYGAKKRVSGLIVANHQSYIDILLLGSIFPLRFAPKSEIRKWPILGWILASSRPVWVNRKSKYASLKTMSEFSDTLKHDVNLITFPEGTTSDGQGDLFPFKSTTFEAAIHGNIKICPVLILYEQNNIAWAVNDNTPLLIHAWRVLQMFQIRAQLHILDPIESLDSGRRKELCRCVYNIMNDRYRELMSLQDLPQKVN